MRSDASVHHDQRRLPLLIFMLLPHEITGAIRSVRNWNTGEPENRFSGFLKFEKPGKRLCRAHSRSEVCERMVAL